MKNEASPTFIHVNNADLSSCNTHRICAERRLLESLEQHARRHGVSQRDTGAWIRRKYGAHITVWRERSDGTLGCSWPCVNCARKIVEYDLVVHAMKPDGAWFSGKLTDPNAPVSSLTTLADRVVGCKKNK
jgi:hypothetical protein